MTAPYLQHVSIPRPRGAADEARAFYGRLLGLPEKPVPNSLTHLDLTWFHAGEGETELHVFSADPWEDTTSRHFCLVVEDLEGMRTKLKDAGYAPWDPEGIPGRPRFFCKDPFGNVVEFTAIEDDYEKFGAAM